MTRIIFLYKWEFNATNCEDIIAEIKDDFSILYCISEI